MSVCRYLVNNMLFADIIRALIVDCDRSDISIELRICWYAILGGQRPIRANCLHAVHVH